VTEHVSRAASSAWLAPALLEPDSEPDDGAEVDGFVGVVELDGVEALDEVEAPDEVEDVEDPDDEPEGADGGVGGDPPARAALKNKTSGTT